MTLVTNIYIRGFSLYNLLLWSAKGLSAKYILFNKSIPWHDRVFTKYFIKAAIFGIFTKPIYASKPKKLSI